MMSSGSWRLKGSGPVGGRRKPGSRKSYSILSNVWCRVLLANGYGDDENRGGGFVNSNEKVKIKAFPQVLPQAPPARKSENGAASAFQELGVE